MTACPAKQALNARCDGHHVPVSLEMGNYLFWLYSSFHFIFHMLFAENIEQMDLRQLAAEEDDDDSDEES